MSQFIVVEREQVVYWIIYSQPVLRQFISLKNTVILHGKCHTKKSKLCLKRVAFN